MARIFLKCRSPYECTVGDFYNQWSFHSLFLLENEIMFEWMKKGCLLANRRICEKCGNDYMARIFFKCTSPYECTVGDFYNPWSFHALYLLEDEIVLEWMQKGCLLANRRICEKCSNDYMARIFLKCTSPYECTVGDFYNQWSFHALYLLEDEIVLEWMQKGCLLANRRICEKCGNDYMARIFLNCMSPYECSW